MGTKPRHPAKDHSTLKQRAAAASIGASSILAAVKLAAGMASGSLALLSEGAHNALDIGASAITFFAVREADKPADADHPFGHAKIEAVAALAETGFLAALSIGVAIQAIGRIRGEGPAVDVGAFAIGAILFSIVVDIVRWRALTRVARLTSSHALKRRRASLFERSRFIRAGPPRARRHEGRISPMPTRWRRSASPVSSPRPAIAWAGRRSMRWSIARPKG